MNFLLKFSCLMNMKLDWVFFVWNTYIAVRKASAKLATNTAAIPNPCITIPVITKPSVLQVNNINLRYSFFKFSNSYFKTTKSMWWWREFLTLEMVRNTRVQSNRKPLQSAYSQLKPISLDAKICRPKNPRWELWPHKIHHWWWKQCLNGELIN